MLNMNVPGVESRNTYMILDAHT